MSKALTLFHTFVHVAVLLLNTLIPTRQEIDRIILTWKSFRDTRNSHLPYIAYTAHKTLYKYRAIQKGSSVSLTFEVRIMLDTPNTKVNFKRLRSLTKNAQLKLLKHEQGHTDLAVIYGRELYSRLTTSSYTPANFKTKTREIYLKLMKKLAEENIRYDNDTEHGFDDEKQRIWAVSINKRLLRY